MNLQYITDSNGETTGVFIPIKEWNDMKSKFEDIDNSSDSVPEWHKEIVRKRMELYNNDPSEVSDFEKTLDEIEKDL
jgi:hypothetical protein